MESQHFQNLDVEFIAMKDDLSQAQSVIKNLTAKISSLQDVIDKKTNVIKKLNEKFEKQEFILDKQKNNLKSLEEFIESLQSGDVVSVCKYNLTNKDVELLSKNIRVVIVGGNDILQNNILSKFPNFKVIKLGNHTFDSKIIKYSDVVCFISRYLDHATFYKAKEIAMSLGKKYIYSGNNNIDIVLLDLVKGIKNIY